MFCSPFRGDVTACLHDLLPSCYHAFLLPYVLPLQVLHSAVTCRHYQPIPGGTCLPCILCRSGVLPAIAAGRPPHRHCTTTNTTVRRMSVPPTRFCTLPYRQRTWLYAIALNGFRGCLLTLTRAATPHTQFALLHTCPQDWTTPCRGSLLPHHHPPTTATLPKHYACTGRTTACMLWWRATLHLPAFNTSYTYLP